MDTVTLNGQKFVLVPEELWAYLTGANSASRSNLQPEPENVLNDFVGPQATNEPFNHPFPQEATQVEKEESIVLVETASPVLDVPLASGRPYDYRQKFLNQELTPADITGYPSQGVRMVKEFRDIDEIEKDRHLPAEEQNFYGPGLQLDGR